MPKTPVSQRQEKPPASNETLTCPPKTGPGKMLDLDEGLGTGVAKRESFWSTMPLEKDLDLEKETKDYNQFRPHSSLRYQPPAPETVLPVPMLETLS